jgi:homospermidine synthase
MIRNPKMGVCLPDDLPHEEILRDVRPYLGRFVSRPVDWTPLDNWGQCPGTKGVRRPPAADAWQFSTFQRRGRS